MIALATLALVGAAALVIANNSAEGPCELDNTVVSGGPGAPIPPDDALRLFVVASGSEFGLTKVSPDDYEATGPGLGGPIVFRRNRIAVTVESVQGRSWVSGVTEFHGDCKERYGVE
ncbi:MAG: hypothetical protein ACT452_19405 [Microthrixaceae bacterium]